MNYKKHYDSLIERARSRVLIGYKESHHVVPKCLGGGNEKSNLVNLTAEEHYVAHQLLSKMHPQNPKLAYAAYAMTVKSRLTSGRNNKLYGWVRRRVVEASILLRSTDEFRAKMSESLKNSSALKIVAEARRGIPLPEEVRRKVGESHKVSEKAKTAREALFQRKVGVPRSEATRQKLSEVQIGKVLTAEHKASIGASLKGRKLAPEQVEQIRNRMTGSVGTRRGAITSDETKAKMRAAALARVYTPDICEKIRVGQNKLTPEQRSARAHKAWATKRAKAVQQEP